MKIEDGYLLEISTTYDEQWQYRSPIVRMPVMLKDVKCKESDVEIFNSRVIPEFNALEAALFSDDFPNNGYEKLVDLRSVAALYLTNELMLNREVTSPRSLFIFREKGEKFRYGPIWDFDYCSGRYPAFNLEHFATESVESTIFRFSKVDDGVLERVDFSLRYFLDPNFVAIYKEVWSEFYSNKELLFDYMESYATTLEASADANYELWDSPYGRGFREEYDRMKEWFTARIEHLNDTINNR